MRTRPLRRALLGAVAIATALTTTSLGAQGAGARDSVVRRDTSATTITGVRVTADAARPVSAKMTGFHERRKAGPGRFLDRDALARWDDARISEALRTLPGLRVTTGGSKAWVSSTRSSGSGQGAFNRTRKSALDKTDQAAGAPIACYLDVYLDGSLVYNSASISAGQDGAMPLFDVNSLSTRNIEGIEVYPSTAQVPAAYNRTSGGCGVMLIWTRDR